MVDFFVFFFLVWRCGVCAYAEQRGDRPVQPVLSVPTARLRQPEPSTYRGPGHRRGGGSSSRATALAACAKAYANPQCASIITYNAIFRCVLLVSVFVNLSPIFRLSSSSPILSIFSLKSIENERPNIQFSHPATPAATAALCNQ